MPHALPQRHTSRRATTSPSNPKPIEGVGGLEEHRTARGSSTGLRSACSSGRYLGRRATGGLVGRSAATDQ